MIVGINHITWNVADIEETFDFYINILGLKPVMKSDWSAYFKAGDTWLAIVKGNKREDSRYDHVAFHVEKRDYDKFVQMLVERNTEQWKENGSEGDSFYFLDPSGNKFELHCSSLKTRIEEGKKNWGDSVTWYE